MATYYWDFKFDFAGQSIDVGLVQGQSDGSSTNITGKCESSTTEGLVYNFNQGDLINFNIFDGSGGCTLNKATITFTGGLSPFSAYVAGSNVLLLEEPVVTPNGNSTAFGGSYPHWMFPEYAIAVDNGRFPFRIELIVIQNGVQKKLNKDPEMIVGGTN